MASFKFLEVKSVLGKNFVSSALAAQGSIAKTFALFLYSHRLCIDNDPLC